MALVYPAIAILCLLCYFKRKFSCFLLLYFAVLTHLLMLDSTGIQSNGADFCILINLVLFFFQFLEGKINLSARFSRYIICFIAFYLLEFAFTTLSGTDSPLNGIKVIRISLIMLSFFVIESIPKTSVQRFLRIAFWITIAQSLLYLLQFAGIHVIYGYNPRQYELYGYYLNIPPMALPFIFLCIKWNYVRKIRPLAILFFSSIVMLTGSRAAILSVILALACYIFIKRKAIGRKKMIGIVLGALVIIPVPLLVIVDKSSKQGDTSVIGELSNILSNPSSTIDFEHGSGTLTFRIAMLVERWVYLIDNPKYMVTGVGTIHEDSEECHRRFNFMLGTANEGRESGICQIESGDITWVPISLRFGILGVFIHLLMFYYCIKSTWQRNGIAGTITPLIICLFILSFDGPFFEDAEKLFIICLLLSFAISPGIKRPATVTNTIFSQNDESNTH